MENNADELIEGFIKTLKIYNPKIFEILNEPISQNFIYKKLCPFYGHQFSEDFSLFFSKICNGTNLRYDETPAVRFHIIGGFFLNSVEEIIDTINGASFYNFIDNKMIPVFTSGYGEYLAIKIDDFINNKFEASIYICSTWDPEIDVITKYCDSINSLIKTNIYCYENKIYTVNDQGLLDDNVEVSFAVCGEMNPNSYYWNRD